MALVPWLRGLRSASPAGAAGLGALLGTLFGCSTGPWLPDALRELGSPPAASFAGLLLVSAWAKGLPFAVVGILVRSARNLPAVAQLLVTGGGVWGVEWLASHWRWGVPWALLGHSQLPWLGVAQLAVVGGVPLISGLLAATNQAIACAIASPRRSGSLRLAAAMAGAWGLLALAGLPVARWVRAPSGDQAVELLLVQPDIPREERWLEEVQEPNLVRVASFSERALREAGAPQLAVWPENLLTMPIEASPELAQALLEWAGRMRVPLVTGLVREPLAGDPDSYRSSVVWIDPQEGITAALDKALAVPVFESGNAFPGISLLASLFGPAVTRWKKVEEAEENGGPLRGSFPVSPVLCYEVLFPGVVGSRRSPDSVALLNLADDGWVRSDTATRQLTDFASFRAIEQRLTLIRVAHGGLSAVVDMFGERTAELPLDAYAYHTVRVAPSPPPTRGERLAILGLPILGALGVWWGTAWLPSVRPRPRRAAGEEGGTP